MCLYFIAYANQVFILRVGIDNGHVFRISKRGPCVVVVGVDVCYDLTVVIITWPERFRPLEALRKYVVAVEVRDRYFFGFLEV